MPRFLKPNNTSCCTSYFESKTTDAVTIDLSTLHSEDSIDDKKGLMTVLKNKCSAIHQFISEKTVMASALLATSVLLTPVVLGMAAPANAQGQMANTAPYDTTQVFFVGNNWDGTVTVIRPDGDFGQIGTINAIPDRSRRLLEIYLNPIKWIGFFYIRHTAGEGNDQLVDDMYSTPDGQSLVISRPSYADVISLNMTSGKINWRFAVDGARADHMAVSPDGSQVAVSASSGNVVHVLDINTGEEQGKFKTGDKPHENIYFAGGSKILNSSIGNVTSSMDAPWQDFTKGKRVLTIADVKDDYNVVKTIDMRPAFDAYGRDDLSSAVRPAVMSPDETKLYGQVSFFNGVFEYDLETDKVTNVVDLPGSDTIPKKRKDWVNDSRHHGLSINNDGSKLCVAGTMDDYVTILDTTSYQYTNLLFAAKPYWATVTPDGLNCVISESEGDSVTVIDFTTGEHVTTVPVGNHPQRVRIGYAPNSWINSQ